MVQCKKGILYIILFAIIRRKETTLMKRKWLFASLLLTAALTMTSCSSKLPVELPFKIPFITADRNTKQNDEDPSDPEKTTDPIITDEPEVPENIDTTENTQSGNDHGSHTPDEADPSPSQPDEDPVDAPSGQENSVNIPVLMGGALPYTGMISIINENYEDGTHRYDDMLEDGMSCIVDYCYVNPEDLPDTPEAYATLAAEKLTDGGIYNILSVSRTMVILRVFPIRYILFPLPAETTRIPISGWHLWLYGMDIRTCMLPAYPAMRIIPRKSSDKIFSHVCFFPIRWTTDAMKKHLTVICYCYVPWQYFFSRADGFSHTNMLHLTM